MASPLEGSPVIGQLNYVLVASLVAGSPVIRQLNYVQLNYLSSTELLKMLFRPHKNSAFKDCCVSENPLCFFRYTKKQMQIQHTTKKIHITRNKGKNSPPTRLKITTIKTLFAMYTKILLVWKAYNIL